MSISYVYRITHKQTSKWYIGSRTASVDPLDDLGVRYFTSGTASEEFKNDPDTFTREILFTHESREVVNAEESRLIDETGAVSDPMAFNIANWPLACDPVKAAAKLRANWNPEWSKMGGIKGAAKLNSVKDESGKSIAGVKAAAKLHSVKDENGKSIASVKGGIKAAAKLNSQFAHAREHGKSSPYWEQYQRRLANTAKASRTTAARAKPFRDECVRLCRQLGIKLDIHHASSYDKFVTYRAQLQAMLSAKETVNG